MDKKLKTGFMMKFKYLTIMILGILVMVSCKQSKNPKSSIQKLDTDSLLLGRYEKLKAFRVDSMAFPRSMSPKTMNIRKNGSEDWTSGFFPGNLWLLYQLTNDTEYRKKAIEWTAFIKKERFNDGTHDTGFMIYCSFGTGLKTMDNSAYRKVVLETAATLCKRFSKNVGSIRSWDFGQDVWEFPVIIDNMMNLELLFEATRISGDSTYHKIAVQHANTTLKNHIRADNSTYHVVDYNSINGKVNKKMTHQGYNDESSWARGQAWAVYGFTMAYRYSRNIAYLEQAKASAMYFLGHKNLPEDGVPYWDFLDPNIPNAPRDASAGAIVASALLELYTYDQNKNYLDYSHLLLKTLKSKDYLLGTEVDGPFILGRSTGDWPERSEIDEAIVYGDYYFLEALVREKSFLSEQSGKSEPPILHNFN